VGTIRERKGAMRWRWKRSRARVGVYVFAVAVLAGCGFWAWRAHRGAFDRLEGDAERGLVAIDRAGRVLWRNADLAPGFSAIALKPDGKLTVVVGVKQTSTRPLTTAENHLLRVYSASSGEVTGQFTLAEAASRFPLDPTFSATQISVVDPDHDGREDALITYTHTPYWPSYSVYVDPRLGKSTPILIASGHHRLAGLADLDGDGVDELLFSGPNNRMGWFTGIAAVRLVPPSAPVGTPSLWTEAGTPDADYARASSHSLVWYSLQPRMSVYSCHLVSADSARRVLRFSCGSDGGFELGYDGFRVGSPSALGPEARVAARKAAYDELRNAQRTGTMGALDRAIGLSREAHAKALAANDVQLAEWISTNEASLLVRAGRATEAQSRFEALAISSDAPSEICWQAAIAFEQQGDLERAAAFHRRGIEEGTKGVWRGRVASDHLESLLVVLAQQERWDEARADLARYEATYPENTGNMEHVRAYIDWRSGTPNDRRLTVSPSRPELFNYCVFELRWAQGVSDHAAFLREINEFRAIKPEPAYLYASLESEVLASMGRTAEAKALAAKALADTTAAAKKDSIARAHLKLVQGRSAEMAHRQVAR